MRVKDATGQNIEILDRQTGEFRSFEEVLNQLWPVWDKLNAVEQANISKALAGTRQRENLLILLNNQATYQKLVNAEVASGGLALDRYGIYLESIEAKTNKLKATSEGMWQDFITSDEIIRVIDLGIAILNLIDSIGGLQTILPIVIASLAMMKAEMVGNGVFALVAGLQNLLGNMAASIILTGRLTSATISFSSAAKAAGIAMSTAAAAANTWIIAITGLIVAYQKYQQIKKDADQSSGEATDIFKDKINEVAVTTNDITAVTSKYVEKMKILKEGLAEISFFGSLVVDKNKMMSDVFKQTSDTLAALTSTYDEYVREMNSAQYETGYVNASLVMTAEQFRQLKAIQDAYNDTTHDSTMAVEGTGTAVAATTKKIYSFIDALLKLTPEISSMRNLLDKGLAGTFTTDDIAELQNLTGYAQKFLIEENGQIKLNIDAFSLYAAEKVKAQMEVARLNNATDLEISILQSLIDEIYGVADAYDKANSFMGKFGETVNNVNSAKTLLEKGIGGTFSAEDITTLQELTGDAEAYLVSEEGQVKLNIEAFRDYEKTKLESMVASYTAAGAAQIEIDILNGLIKALDEVADKTDKTKDFVGFFNASLMQASDLAGSFKEISDNLQRLNQDFRDGSISSDEYFSQINEQLKNIDFEKSFAGNKQAAQSFFYGMVENSYFALGKITEDFEKQKISVTDYTDQLSKLGDLLLTISDYTSKYGSSLGLTSGEIANVVSNTDTLSSSVGELIKMQELNVVIQDAFTQSLTGSLEFGTKAFEDYADKIGYVAEQSGVVFKDINGNALSSADEISNYLKAVPGNLQNITDQMANQTGSVVNRMVRSAGTMLLELYRAMQGFKLDLNIRASRAGGSLKIPLTASAGGFTIPLPTIEIPNIDIKVGTNLSSGTSGGFDKGDNEGVSGTVSNPFKIIEDTLKELSTTDFGLDWTDDIYKTTAAMETASKAAGDYSNKVGSISNKFNELKKAAQAAANQAKDDAKFLDELLKIVIERIKQQKQAEKDALQQSLESYKAIIDKRKELLKSKQEELNYDEQLAEKNSSLAKIQGEILQLKLDDSEEAKAKRLKLEEEAAKIQKDINKTQRDQGFKEEEKALDSDYGIYEKYIKDKIKVIDDYLSKSGQITLDAIALINQKSSGFYEELISWNRIYGDGIDMTITNAWNNAYDALERYRNLAGKIDYQFALNAIKEAEKAANALLESLNSLGGGGSGGKGSGGSDSKAKPSYKTGSSNVTSANGKIAAYHDGGVVEGSIGQEVFAKLMSGETVVTRSQAEKFMKYTLPGLAKISSKDMSGSMSFGSLINMNVEGNLDSSVLPKIEDIVNNAVMKLNNSMFTRGITRKANQYGV